MGLFKAKKKEDGIEEQESSRKKKFPFLKRHTTKQQQHSLKEQTKEKEQLNNEEQQNRQPSPSRAQQRQLAQTRHDTATGAVKPQRENNVKENLNEEEEEEEDLGDIPRSISTPSRDGDCPLPPLPATPKEGVSGVEGSATNNRAEAGNNDEEEDSIGSPCDAMFKHQNKHSSKLSNNATNTSNTNTKEEEQDPEAQARLLAQITKLQSITLQPPSLSHLPHYISSLSYQISPDPSGDLPSRALRCLFSLSEHSNDRQRRIDMVHGRIVTMSNMDIKDAKDGKDDAKGKDNGTTQSSSQQSLVPALLSFLQRCPRDSSEQYLTLLVLNNLSIPQENKRAIALEYGGAKTLGRLLCEDVGCHLLVIVIVNLTFDCGSGGGLNRDLLTVGNGRKVLLENDEEEKSFVSCGGDVQLVDSLGYALLLASLTTEQLSALGPIPLTSPEGIHYTPRKLLSLLFSLLEEKLGIQYRNSGFVCPAMDNEEGNNNAAAIMPLALGGDDCPFPETARWCLGALKNLTRPGKLAPSLPVVDTDNEEEQGAMSDELGFLNNKDGSAVAAQSILDAGILPLLLRILKYKENSNDDGSCTSCTLYSWRANSAQDAALYTLMHMSSVPGIQRVLREEYGCVEVLTSILNYGRVVGDKLLKAATGTLNVEAGAINGSEEENVELCHLSLQCLKARLALSYLILGVELNNTNETPSKYGSVTTLTNHELPTLLELLSHCLQCRAKEGPGGYSAATFTLKGVLYGIRCILNEPKNRELFAESTANNGSRLNALLLNAVARYSPLDTVGNVMDAEAAEHAVVSMYQMSLYSLDQEEIGFASPFGGGGPFLVATFGENRKKMQGKSAVAKVLTAFLNKDGISPKGRHAANQILFRLNILRFEGSVADLPYSGKAFPAKADFDLDDKVLTAIKTITGEELHSKGAKPTEYIFKRAITRNEKEGGVGSKVFSSAENGLVDSGPKTFSSALLAAEELAWIDVTAQHQKEPGLDVIAVANNISYYADGLDVYYGYTWKWDDGGGDLIERIYSAAETEDQILAPEEEKVNDETDLSEPYSPPRKGFLGRLKISNHGFLDDSEPFSIFGLRCAAPMCGKGSVL